MRMYGAIIKMERKACDEHAKLDSELYFEGEGKNEQDATRNLLMGALHHYPQSKATMVLLSRLKNDRPVKEHYLAAFRHGAAEGVHIVDAATLKQANASSSVKALKEATANTWPPKTAKPVTVTSAPKKEHSLDKMLNDELFETIAEAGTFTSK